MKKKYFIPEIRIVHVGSGRLLAGASGYLPYITQTDDGTRITGYIIDHGHEDDDDWYNYITDYILALDAKSFGTVWDEPEEVNDSWQ